MPSEKICTKCGGDPQPLDHFYKSSETKDGRVSRCKKCTNQDTQERQQKRHIPDDISSLTRICSKCGGMKPLSDFHKSKNSPDGRVSICKICRSIRKPKISKVAPISRVCSHPACDFIGILQPIENFPLRKSARDGHSRRCTSCEKKAQEKWVKNNIEKVRAKARKAERKKTLEHPDRFKGVYQKMKETNPEAIRKQIIRLGFYKFRVTQQWFDDKLASQNGKCAICGTEKENQQWARFCIDHDHSCCGKYKACDKCRRGLLCHKCNIKLGMIEDVEWITLAVAYLTKHGKDLSRILESLTTDHLPNSTVTAPS
jgi:hypothetical protein